MKTKTKAYALLLALGMFLLSLFSLGGVIRANAYDPEMVGMLYSGYQFPEPVPDEEYEANPDKNLTSLYYFSDYEGSEECFENGYVRKYINMNPNIKHSELIYRNPSEFWDIVNVFLAATPIQNAFIIFEKRYDFPSQAVAYNENLPPYEETIFGDLGNIFSTLKENQCKIMYIDGLDEMRYVDYNMFLEYVDMHVIVDLFTTFIFSALDYVAEDNGDGWRNVTLVLDENFGQDWFIKKYLAPYLLFECEMMRITSLEEIFQRLDISIYVCHKAVGTDGEADYIFESKWNTNYDDDDFYQRFNDSDYDVILGCYDFLNDAYLLNLLDERGRDGFAYFVYNALEEPWPEEIAGETLCGGIPLGSLNYYLSVITRAFILNDNSELQKFDNVEGRCDATFIPMKPGNGWQKRKCYFGVYFKLPPDVPPSIFN